VIEDKNYRTITRHIFEAGHLDAAIVNTQGHS
jgi:hypothetical protein